MGQLEVEWSSDWQDLHRPGFIRIFCHSCEALGKQFCFSVSCGFSPWEGQSSCCLLPVVYVIYHPRWPPVLLTYLAISNWYAASRCGWPAPSTAVYTAKQSGINFFWLSTSCSCSSARIDIWLVSGAVDGRVLAGGRSEKLTNSPAFICRMSFLGS